MKKKAALITGGSRGIGLGIARWLAREGWDLVINGMREEAAVSHALKSLDAGSNQVIYCQGNVAVKADRENMMARTLETFGQINLLVNNAGVAPTERTDLLEMSEESYDRVMDINLKGAFFLSQLAAKEMMGLKKQESDFSGSIINISSVSATMVSVNRGEYCISKAGMSMMTQLFAARLGENDISVYEIRPGLIDTDMTAPVKEKYDLLLKEGLAVQPRWGYPEDVGKVVAALARGDLPYSTGQVIMVDGGLALQRL